MAKAKGICSLDGCGKPHHQHGYCQAHFARWRRHGDPLGGRIKRVGCSVAGCAEKHHAKGYCAVHLARFNHYGDPLGGGQFRSEMAPQCSVEGCNAPREAKGLCVRHYDNLRRRGSADAQPTRASEGEGLDWLRRHVGHIGDDCLTWPFGNGYGSVLIGGRAIKAHRQMCILAHGEPPTPRHQAAHNCGRGEDGCVHPQHLRWDTPAGNLADRWAHGTVPLGENAWNSKLTVEAVRWARRMAGTMTYREMSEALGVHWGTIRHAVVRETWAWLD